MSESIKPSASSPSLGEASVFKSQSGIDRLRKAFGYSLEGLASAFRHEAAFRQELFATVILVPLACVLPVPILAKLFLVGVIVQTLVAELLNSSLEWAVDYISTDEHPVAKRVKDIGSAAVFLSITWGLVVWTAIVVTYWGPISQGPSSWFGA